MPKRLGLMAAGAMRALLAPDRAHARKLDAENEAQVERPKHKCCHPDCNEQTHATFCSPGCCQHFKANFRAVGGRNVRIDRPHGDS
jgi:hypothetical protein